MPAPPTAPDPLADPPERAALRSSVRSVIDAVAPPARTAALDEAETFDDDLFAALAGIGVFAAGGPPGVGGLGDVRDQLVVVEELGAGPTSMAAYAIAHYAVTQTVATHGHTPDHRDLARRLVAGTTHCSFALSEPAGGTDVARVMTTRAAPVPGGWRIDGEKRWTSGATMAEAIVVLARTAPAAGRPVDGITMFLVPSDAPGLAVTPIPTFGIRGCSTCEVVLDGVVVPEDAVLGEVGRGMRQVFATVDREGLNAAAACLGVGRAALAETVAYVAEREVFGRPVGSYQSPQHRLVDAAVALEGARSLLWRAAELEVRGAPAGDLAAMAKLAASEAAERVARDGMQLLGGTGYTRDVAVTRLFRDVRLWAFSPLANEMVRNRIGSSYLGLPRAT